MEYRQAYENEKKINERERRNEENAYLLKRESARKQDQEQYKILKDELEQELVARREAFEQEFEAREARLAAREQEHKQLKEREAWITAREQEYTQLKERVAQYPDDLRLSVQKAERTVAEQLTRKYEYDAKLAQIELESKDELYKQKITALEKQIEQYKTLKQLFNQSSFKDAEKA